MTILDLLHTFLHDAPVAVVVTDAAVERPGPVILYANPAFGRLTGRNPDEIVGLSPRFMQGRETRRPVLDLFAAALRAGERFHGFLTNYRADGTRYVAEVDCRPLADPSGRVVGFISFEREVVRRRGRPAAGSAGRFEQVEGSNELLTDALLTLNLFNA